MTTHEETDLMVRVAVYDSAMSRPRPLTAAELSQALDLPLAEVRAALERLATGRVLVLQPESREAYQRLLAQGWTDAIHRLHAGEPMYTFWDHFRNRWERNAGLRIDHLLLNRPAAARLTAAGVDRVVRGREKPSDHAPAWVELAPVA